MKRKKERLKQQQQQQQRKKVSTHLLHLAEHDEFLHVLHMLLSPSYIPHINHNAKTSSGDYLVTLLAYATGEWNNCDIADSSGSSSSSGNDDHHDDGVVVVVRLMQRVYALKCLRVVLERDFTAVNKVGNDGGAALHCVLAAAACDEATPDDDTDHDHDHDDDDDGSPPSHDSDSDAKCKNHLDHEEDSDSDDESEYSDSDQEEEHKLDAEFMGHIKASARNDTPNLERYCAQYNSLSSSEITWTAIRLLLHHGADVNIPLGNAYELRNSQQGNGYDRGKEDHDGGDGEDNDEIEWTFAKESMIQQWTPLMFATQWVILATIQCIQRPTVLSSLHKHNHSRIEKDDDHYLNSWIHDKLALPLAVIGLLLDFDADKSYMMAGKNYDGRDHDDNVIMKDWNVVQVFASASHILHRVVVDDTMLIRSIEKMMNRCMSVLAVEDGVTRLDHDDDDDDESYRKSLLSRLKDDPQKNDGEARKCEPLRLGDFIIRRMLDANNTMPLSPIASFAVAVLTNDAQSATSILDHECESKSNTDTKSERELRKRWSGVKLKEILPTIQAAWANTCLMNDKTLLDVTCSCTSLDVLRVLMGDKRGENSSHQPPSLLLSDDQIRRGVISVFENLGRRSISKQEEQSKEADADGANAFCSNPIQQLMEQQKQMISQLLQQFEFEFPQAQKTRQIMLDRLLLESCTAKPWTYHAPHAILVLLQLGADPNIQSLLTSTDMKIQNGFTPLHLIAGNCRGGDGIQKLNWLLGGVGKQNVEWALHFEKANIYIKTQSLNEMPIHIALRKQNFKAARRLLEELIISDDEEEKYWREMQWSVEDATLIGHVAIDCADVQLFRKALLTIISSVAISASSNCSPAAASGGGGDSKTVTEKRIGGLLLKVLDERSGFGKVKPLNDNIGRIIEAIHAVDRLCDDYQLTNVCSWARDEISGYNVIHQILRGDRGEKFRSSLLRPICELVVKTKRGSNNVADRIMNQSCSEKFGGYTPLHLAAALGCRDSITTLLEFRANVNAKDAKGRSPML